MNSSIAPFKNNISLVGLMGVGKTSVGRRLAPLLKIPFFDADIEIELAAEMKIADIFEGYGEREFRRLEQRVIERLLSDGPCVLATGGGAFGENDTRQIIKKHSLSVWMDAEIDTLVRRTQGRNHRPLLHGKDHSQVLTQLKKKRDPFYAQADIRIQSFNNSDENEIVRALIAQIELFTRA